VASEIWKTSNDWDSLAHPPSHSRYNLEMILNEPTGNQVVSGLAIVCVASLTAEWLWGTGGVFGLALPLFLAIRLGAQTIHAFIEGINEGDDPRRAKRPPDAP